jgi:hypothetical protein
MLKEAPVGNGPHNLHFDKTAVLSPLLKLKPSHIHWGVPSASPSVKTQLSIHNCQVRTHSGPPFPITCPLWTSTHGAHTLELEPTTSASLSILNPLLLSIGLVVNVSPYLISLPLILSYLISFLYLIVLFPLFIVWMMVAPATPSRSILVSSLPCLTQVNMVRALVCAPTV